MGRQEWVVPPVKQVAVTPSDETVYNPPLVSIFVGTVGDVRLILVGDKDTFDCTNAPIHKNHVGLLRGRIIQVCATGTDAEDIIGYTTDP